MIEMNYTTEVVQEDDGGEGGGGPWDFKEGLKVIKEVLDSS